MTDPKPTRPEAFMVWARQHPKNAEWMILGEDVGKTFDTVHVESLHPLPASITPLQQAVIDAADKRVTASGMEWRATHEDYAATPLADAVMALRLSLAPPEPPKPVDPVTVMGKALRQIENINNGPDQASGTWRCGETAAIAKAALISVQNRLATPPSPSAADIAELIAAGEAVHEALACALDRPEGSAIWERARARWTAAVARARGRT